MERKPPKAVFTPPGKLPPARMPKWVVVATGGALGALLRLFITLVIPEEGPVVWSILGINVLGSALLGMLSVLVALKWPHRPGINLFWGVGVLGGFTTFSTVMVAVVALPAQRTIEHVTTGELWHAYLIAILYLLLNIVLSVVAAWGGTLATETVLQRKAAKATHTNNSGGDAA